MNILNLLCTLILFVTFTNLTGSDLIAGPTEIKFLNSKPSSPKLPFSEAVQVGDLLFLSGQLGIDPKTEALAPGGTKQEARQALENIKGLLKSHGYKMSDVVKCLVMLTSSADYKAFNSIYVTYFSPPYPARSAFAAKELALNASVEIECIAAKERGMQLVPHKR